MIRYLSLKEGEIEGRCALLSTFFLSLAIYSSNFSIFCSLISIAISTYFTEGKNLKIIFAFFPFYILILLSGFLFSLTNALKSSLAFASLLSVGSLMYSSKIKEVSGALIFFKIPRKFVSIFQLAISILPLLINDLKEISEVIDEKGLAYYKKLLKIFVSTSILRALSLSEALFSKNFNYIPIYEIRMPRKKDFILLSLSLLLFLSTLLLNPLYLRF